MKQKILPLLTISGSMLLTFSVTAAETDAKTVKKNQVTPDSIVQSFNKEYNEIRLSILPEKDIPKRRARFKAELPKPTDHINRIIQLAKENPQAEGTQKALMSAMGWTLSSHPSMSIAQRKEMTNLFLTHYRDSKYMLDLALFYTRPLPGGQEALDVLHQISEKAANPSVALKAAFYAASILLLDEATQQEGLAQMKKLAATPNLKKTDPEIFTFANGAVLQNEQLQVGLEAPDIIGTDHEGKEFKLSDYRGKVVLLSFWATW